MKLFKIFRREGSPVNLSPVIGAKYGDNVVYVSSEESAMKIAAVYRAVSLISTGIASLTFQYKRYNTARKYYFIDQNSYDCKRTNYVLNVQPNSQMKAFDFWRAAVSQVLLKGNAYIYPELDMYGRVSSLILCTADSVIYDRMSDTYRINDWYNGISEIVPSSGIIHLKNYCSDGVMGVSTISYAANVLGIAATSDSETLRRFATGGRFKAIISNNTTTKGFGEYQDKELKNTAKDIEEKLRSGQDIISLPGDNQVTNISMSSTDMQFLDSRKFTIREIARFFGIPAQKLMDDSNSVYGSAEEANLAFFSEGLQPIAEGIVQELTAKLIGFQQYGSYKIDYRMDKLLAMNRKAQSEWNKSRLESGLVSPNDLRRESDIEPVDKGDDVYLSVNLAPVGSEKLNGTTAKTDGTAV